MRHNQPPFLLTLLGLCMMFSGCSMVSEAIPPSKQEAWNFEADVDSRCTAYIAKGDTCEKVLEIMGAPHERSRFTSNPNIEVLQFKRIVRGPLRVRQIKTTQGYKQVQAPVMYEVIIDAYFDHGVLVSVSVDKHFQEMPYFGRPD